MTLTLRFSRTLIRTSWLTQQINSKDTQTTKPYFTGEWTKCMLHVLLAAPMIITMSRVVGGPTFCLCESKDADQLRGNHRADLRLCFSSHM